MALFDPSEVVRDPLYANQPELGKDQAYFLACYYGPKPQRRARGRVKEGDLAIEVRLLSKSALLMEIAASRAREARGEIGKITVEVRHVRGRLLH